MYYLHKWNLLQRKSSRRRFENENASAPHSDLLLISFLIPVIALSGVKSKAGRGSSWAYLWCIGWAMIPSLSNVDTKWFDAKCQSTRWFPNFWVGVRNGVGEKIALILKGLPPSHHLIGKRPQHYNWWCDVWLMWLSQWNCLMPHRKIKNWNGKLNAKLFASPHLVGCFNP